MRVRILWTTCLLAALAGTAFAETETVGAYTWTYSVLETPAGEDGTDPVAADAEIMSVSPVPEGDVEVPASLGALPVGSLAAELFADCANLTSVTLPTSVTNVGASAFKGCASLSRVRIQAPVVKFGSKPFAGCTAVESVEMPVRSAFSTLFPDAVANLREAVVAEGSEKMAKNAFAGCTALTSVTLPDTLTEIGSSAFAGCTNLTSVTLPASVTTVWASAFKDCASLSRVRIQAPVVKFGSKPFAGCTAVEFVEMPVRSAFSTLFPDAVANLREAVVAEGSEKMAKNVFKGCTALTSVTLPDTLTEIGSSAFAGCTNLTSVTLPASVTSVGASAFKDCASLSRVRIQAPVVKFGSKPFAGCTAVEFVEASGKTSVAGIFPNSGGSLREVFVTDGSEKLADNFLKGCTNLVSVSLPSSVTSIGSAAFRDCTSLETLELPESLEKVAKNAFAGCSALASLTFRGGRRPSTSVDLSGTPEDLVVRVSSSSQGWDGIVEWGGRPLEFFVDSGVPYVLEPLDPARIVAGIDVAKAFSAGGCAMDGTGRISAAIELKIGRAGRAGSKVGVVLNGVDGKKTVLGSAAVDLSAGPSEIVLEQRRSENRLRLVLGRDAAGAVAFSGWWGCQVVRSAPVGGELTKRAVFSFPEGFARDLPGGVVERSFLPENEPVTMAGRRWTLAGAAKIAYRRNGNGEYGWMVNGGKTDSPKTNLSGLKLQYAPKLGTFKGSFSAYPVLDNRLRKTGVKVTGVVVDGVGYGLATVPKTGAWPVLVK